MGDDRATGRQSLAKLFPELQLEVAVASGMQLPMQDISSSQLLQSPILALLMRRVYFER